MYVISIANQQASIYIKLLIYLTADVLIYIVSTQKVRKKITDVVWCRMSDILIWVCSNICDSQLLSHIIASIAEKGVERSQQLYKKKTYSNRTAITASGKRSAIELATNAQPLFSDRSDYIGIRFDITYKNGSSIINTMV